MMTSFGRLKIHQQLDSTETQSFVVTDPERGKDVFLHVLPADRTEANSLFWDRLEAGLEAARNFLVEQGAVLGVRYVVTEASPNFTSLVDQLEHFCDKPQISADSEKTASNSKQEQPGEFTRMFSNAAPVSPGAETFSPPITEPFIAPVAPVVSEPGEFTRMFQLPPTSAPRPETLPEKSVPQKPLPETSWERKWDTPKPVLNREEEKTKIYSTPLPSPAPAASDINDFSNYFQSPMEARKEPIHFQAAAAEPSVPAPTRGPSEFTERFGKPASLGSSSPPPHLFSSGNAPGATDVFSMPSAQPARPQSPASQEPSEYSQLFANPAKAPLPPPPSPPIPPASSALAPRDPKKQVPMPTIVMFVVLGLLLVLAIELVLYFALRH